MIDTQFGKSCNHKAKLTPNEGCNVKCPPKDNFVKKVLFSYKFWYKNAKLFGHAFPPMQDTQATLTFKIVLNGGNHSDLS